jgi:hypothetical protein
MQPLDAGHLLAGLADLESVADEHEPPVAAQQLRMEVHHERRPQPREPVHIQRRTVEEVQEPVIAHGLQPQRAHEAGDAPQVLAHAQPHQDHAHPHKRPVPCARPSQRRAPPPPFDR